MQGFSLNLLDMFNESGFIADVVVLSIRQLLLPWQCS